MEVEGVVLNNDNRTGEGSEDADDETTDIDLSSLDDDI